MQQFEKFLLLHGGVDVNPRCYEQAPLVQTQHPDTLRDAKEFAAVAKAFATDMPVVGICRGAQLLCVANGGTLWQHAVGHGGGHALALSDGRTIENAEAGHHQIMNLYGTIHKVLAWSPFDTIVLDEFGLEHVLKKAPEVVWFPMTRSLAIQPHPEWEEKGSPFKQYVNNLIYDYLDVVPRDVF